MKRIQSIFGMGLALFGYSVVAVGCSGAPDTADPVDLVEPEVLAADSQYMRSLVEKAGGQGAIKIDLSDDRQFAFVKNRLRQNGIDPETAPRVFEGLQRARDKAIAIKTGTVDPRIVTSSQGAADRCGIYVVNEQLDSTKFISMARGSCIGGATYSYVDQYQYDKDWNALAYGYKEEWNKGIATDVKLTSTPPTQKGVFAEGFVYKETSSTVESYYYTTSTYGNHLPDTTSALAPGSYSTQAVKAPGTPIDGFTYAPTAPKDVTGNGSIMYCLYRSADSADCDYKHTDFGVCAGLSICEQNTPKFPIDTPTLDKTKLYMPMAGSSLPAHGPTYQTANPWVVRYARAWLTMRTAGAGTPAGGFCSRELTTSPKIRLQNVAQGAIQRVQVVIDPFAPSLGNAGWPDYCVDNGKQVDLDVEVTIYQPNNALNSDRVYNWTTRATTGTPSAPPMSIWWGCLPTGTEITLSGDKRVPIQQVAVGQKVMSDDHGRMLTVVDVVEGTERKPLVRIVDDHGNALTMTTTHAVPLASANVVQAQEMRIGDRIMTKDGLSTIVAVDRLEYEGPVYNLVLGTAEELGTISRDGTTMYANGVLVGDSRLQGAITQLRADEAAQADRVASLPEEFKTDYRLSLVREQKRAAKH